MGFEPTKYSVCNRALLSAQAPDLVAMYAMIAVAAPRATSFEATLMLVLVSNAFL